MSNEPQDFDDMVFHNMVGWRDRSNRMEIERDALRTENARLREALKIVAAGVDTFCINPEGGADIVVEGGSRFAHEEDVLPLIYAARAALDGEVKP